MVKKVSVLLAALFVILTASASAEYNKYNELDYVNAYNMTLQDIADDAEMTVEEFKEYFGLPEDMPADTNETAAYSYITVEKMAELHQINLDEAIAEMKMYCKGDFEITKDTLYKDVEDNMPIKNYIGDIDFEDFKAVFELDNELTEDSMFGKIRTKLQRIALWENKILSYDEGNSILVMLNGKYLDFDVAPIIINDRVMVPMRNIFEALGSVVNWDGETKTIFANKGSDIITMQVGQSSFFKNAEKIEIDSPSVIENERTLVPIRAVAEALDTQVFYNENTKTVVIH
ncbi:MAG: copper amine oxidase N-terminal domain-containing protein [Clostridia bacterium]|nr:copper amine oxidase N-terminal domain-containing protein [Clostridia bacterium]